MVKDKINFNYQEVKKKLHKNFDELIDDQNSFVNQTYQGG